MISTIQPILNSLRFAPLVPITLAISLGDILDRSYPLPFAVYLVATLVSLLFWRYYRKKNQEAAYICLLFACISLFAAHHQQYREQFRSNDISLLLKQNPKLIRIRGTLAEEPLTHYRIKENPLAPRISPDPTFSVLEPQFVQIGSDWIGVSGRTQLIVDGTLSDIHVGDQIEVLGWLSLPAVPLNPGENDYRSYLKDQQIHSVLRVTKSNETVVRLEQGWPSTMMGWLAIIRGHSQRKIQENLKGENSGLAMALLLGEGSTLTRSDWEQYIRTGVIHVLAISGQHLMILGGFLWIVLRLFPLNNRRIAIIVTVVLFGYALLTGGRPSAMRAAFVVGVASVGFVFNRKIYPANALAFAWILVLIQNPSELFHSGFQLSFLAVIVLIWGLPQWFPNHEMTPLEVLIDESRPASVRLIRKASYWVFVCYRLTLMITLANLPLLIFWQNIVSPVGILIGPPIVLLTTIALIAGLLMILLGTILPFLSFLPAWVVDGSLTLCQWIVSHSDHFALSSWFVGNISLVWVSGFYLLGLAWLLDLNIFQEKKPPPEFDPNTIPLPESTLPVPNPHRRWICYLLVWSIAGLLFGYVKPRDRELHLTFLAVGHGGCTILETPNGQTILYDAGAIGQMDVGKKIIAPYLWSRGITRIDEIILSHADLDHFNAVPSLLERFSIGQITYNPTFSEKESQGVRYVIQRIEQLGIPVRVVKRGDQLRIDTCEIDVLHPTLAGPDGVENVRSMVILVKHAGHHILLTGDIEKNGLNEILNLAAPKIDILMAPHHGSPAALPSALLVWAKPKLIIAADGPPRGNQKTREMESVQNIPYWSTYRKGAITIRSHATGLIVESFLAGEKSVITMGK